MNRIPEVLGGAILLRPMFITDSLPERRADGGRVLILAGEDDPLMHPGDPERLRSQLEGRGATVTLEVVPHRTRPHPAGHGAWPPLAGPG